jgi:hypothetical protein
LWRRDVPPGARGYRTVIGHLGEMDHVTVLSHE